MTVATRTARPNLRTRLGALLAVGAMAGALAVAGPADARPKGGTTGASGCPVEHEDGSVTYVPVGTRIGLFHCGSDGEWHFGGLVDSRVAPTTTTGGVITNGVLSPTAAPVKAIG
jgi:hypothetical protein